MRKPPPLAYGFDFRLLTSQSIITENKTPTKKNTHTHTRQTKNIYILIGVLREIQIDECAK